MRLTELDGSHWNVEEGHAERHEAFLHRQLVARTHVVHGLEFACPAGIYQPDEYSSTRFLLRELCASPGRFGAKVLDVGTGCGAIAIVLAHLGKDATALDLDPAAVACARANAERNGATVRVAQSDLFAAVAGATFDLIVFNPPLCNGRVEHPASHVANDPDGAILHRFLEEAPRYLAPDGWIAFLAANVGHKDALLDDLATYDHHVAAADYHTSSGGVFRWVVFAQPLRR